MDWLCADASNGVQACRVLRSKTVDSMKSAAAQAAIDNLKNRATAHLTKPKLAASITDFHPKLDIGVYKMFNHSEQLWVNGHYADVADPRFEMTAMKTLSTGQIVQMFRVLFKIPL